MPKFNLTDEKWIPVLRPDGRSDEVSLVDIFTQAKDIVQITGNPLEAAVLHRLVFAITQWVRTPKNVDEWLVMWKDRTSCLGEIATYLRDHAQKFDLYSQECPFGQHPGLQTADRTPAEILYDRAQGNNPVFLDSSLVSAPTPIPSAMAARGLLVTHAYGGSGTGGLNPLNGNKKDTMYAGPLCARMVCFLEGKDIEETILLNALVLKPTGRPSWERTSADSPKQTLSEGVCDLYTRKTRNIRLSPSEDGVKCLGVAVVMGEGVLADDEVSGDPMIPVYFAKDNKFKALRLDSGKALWRCSQVLMIHEETDQRRPLSSISQLGKVLRRDLLADRSEIRLRSIGVAANAQGPVTEIWRDEALPFRLSLFMEKTGYADLSAAVTKAEGEADLLRRHLYGFANRYLSDGGGAADPKDVARLIEELSPGLNDFWSVVGPTGENLAVSNLDDEKWTRLLSSARLNAFSAAIDRLALDSRRMRAQFARSENTNLTSKPKKGRQTA
jgi:CRISPR system Cascade subunit CasA